MGNQQARAFNLKWIDIIPAISGLIGKTALVTSFAVVWAQAYRITASDFVYENVRIEIIIGSIITLIAALLLRDAAPSGTLAPLIVLIPSMAAFGVHPLILSILVGILGILSIKTKLFHKLLSLSGSISKTSLTLTVGLSGVILSLKNLIRFFNGVSTPFLIIFITLSFIIYFLMKQRRNWLIIPVSAVISLIVPYAFGIRVSLSSSLSLPTLNPSYWWNEMWGIGYGFQLQNVIRALPFAVFIIILWAVDTVSIRTMLESNYGEETGKPEMNLDRSFLITSLRNIIGGIFGGAQTSALWRSYLIPLSMMRRPLYPSSVLLGVLGCIAGFTGLPVMVLSFPPLIWFVLLFGIFLPFVMVGIQGIMKAKSCWTMILILAFSAIGIFFNPVFTWLGALVSERLFFRDKL
jgi:hypothetical protein